MKKITYIGALTGAILIAVLGMIKTEKHKDTIEQKTIEIQRLERDSIITHELLNNCSSKSKFDIVSEVRSTKKTFSDLEEVIQYQIYVIDSLEREIVRYYRTFID